MDNNTVFDIASECTLTPAQIDFCKSNIPHFSCNAWSATIAAKAGSDRSFIRLAPKSGRAPGYILILWDSHDHDWDRFIKLHAELSPYNSLLPQIYALDERHGLILEEDCGEVTLKEYSKQHEISSDVIEKIYQRVIDKLVLWESIDSHVSPTMRSRELDKAMYLWETEYFATHCVSEYCGLDPLLTSRWEKEREDLAQEAESFPRVCLHRDFQSENIMLMHNAIKFVDYQGARLGAAAYDVASLLCDPYISVISQSQRYQLLAYYQQVSVCQVTDHMFHIAAIQRLMQALGAYGNLSLHKGKQRYREYIPHALSILLSILQKIDAYPVIKDITETCLDKISMPPG